jgi:hypothetical protein
VVYVVQGGASFWTGSLSGADAILTGSLSSSDFGASLDTIPDIDGDGDDELLVGAPSAPYSYGGAAYIFEGPLAGAVTTSAADGEVAGTIAVLGPTRMDYQETVAAVAVVSQRLTRILTEG